MFSLSLPRWVVPTAMWVLRIVTAGALAISAYLHADLAYRYDPNQQGGLSQGTLFRWAAGAAALAALVVLVICWRTVWSLVAWAMAFVVAASALGAVMIYAHYDLGRLGPLPDMYEPFWFGEKTRVAVAEAIATGTAALGFVLTAWWVRAGRRSPAARQTPVDRTYDRVGGRAT